ncbi:Carotenoid oxygenase [Parasponia andersonii]|uniref:Carotenoid oxygenase n=1 Tax=Parasponia andersonii TaxID=3476 RepID=A0A2P5A821_PARAD|nr:Carotenoid oxygenase [Parasponia andersonii]
MLRAFELAPAMRIDISKTIKNTTANLLDAFVDSAFEFVNQPLLPSQRNFAPVDELGGPVAIAIIQGSIPDNLPEGVYIRNGANPLFEGLKSTKSVFGKSSRIWVEGEGMLHALYFSKDDDHGINWTVHYNNRYVETETFNQEKQRNKPYFLPITGGDFPALLSASLLNLLRFGKVDKYMSNTNVFEHSGKVYAITKNHVPQEIDISTLETLGNWDLSTAWNRCFTSHPKRAPGTGELVITGMKAIKPYIELGVISADGKKFVHRADLKLGRCTFFHDFRVTKRYNVFLDFPLTIDITSFVSGGGLMKYDKEGYATMGVMPRYGDADSITWFKVDTNCTFHIFNCFEDGDEENETAKRHDRIDFNANLNTYENEQVVVWRCRALESVVLCPRKKNFDTSIKDGLLYDRPHEWRLNMRTGEVWEANLTADTEFSVVFRIDLGTLKLLTLRQAAPQV